MIPQCAYCKRLISMNKRACEAYPSGIPDAIWLGEVDHTKPYEDDDGLQFQERT
jgi:hypothetical protein